MGEKIYFSTPGVCEGEAVMKLSALGLVVATAVVWSAPVTIDLSPTKTPSLSVDTADARLGRPLTPMSVAGVNRRWHRRAALRGGGGWRGRLRLLQLLWPPVWVLSLSRVLVFAEAKEHRLPGGALGE